VTDRINASVADSFVRRFAAGDLAGYVVLGDVLPCDNVPASLGGRRLPFVGYGDDGDTVVPRSVLAADLASEGLRYDAVNVGGLPQAAYLVPRARISEVHLIDRGF
jgi:hypothetical protein